jgi:hypothetical protein
MRATPTTGPAPPISLRRRPLVAALVVLVVVAAVAAACGGGSDPGDESFPLIISPGEGDIFPAVTNHTLEVGENRFSMRLADPQDVDILDAQVGYRFFDLNSEDPVLKSQSDALFIPVELSFVDEASGGERRLVGSSGVYVATIDFDGAGSWGVIVDVTLDGEAADPIPFRFSVLEDSPEPSVGDPAIPSRQAILADVADISEIDTSSPPRPHMHDTTVAEALMSGRPTVVAFATPAFCEIRACGPVMDTIMDPLFENYGGEAVFIQIEPYRLKELGEGVGQIPVPAMTEWNIQTEPWIFVVDRHGLIAGKFEGITGRAEVEAVLLDALARDGGD